MGTLEFTASHGQDVQAGVESSSAIDAIVIQTAATLEVSQPRSLAVQALPGKSKGSAMGLGLS